MNDADFQTVNDYMIAIWKLDEATFVDLIADDANIKYKFNDVEVNSNNERICRKVTHWALCEHN